MTIRVSDEVKTAVVGAIDDLHADFEDAAAINGVRLTNAILAESSTDLFISSWATSVGELQDLLTSTSLAVGATMQALIDADRDLADASRIGPGPR